MHEHLLQISSRLRLENLTGPINPLDPHSSNETKTPLVKDKSNINRKPSKSKSNNGLKTSRSNSSSSNSQEAIDNHPGQAIPGQGNSGDSWVVVGSDSDSKDPRWFELFVEFFIEGTLEGGDDLLFFVKENHDGSLGYNPTDFLSGPSNATGEYDPIFVRRKMGSKLPDLSEVIDWKQTFFLNMIIQLPCLLTVSVCKKEQLNRDENDNNNNNRNSKTKQKKSKMVAVRRIMKKVYAAPYKARMDKKDSFMNECSYPLIYYSVNDYECEDLQMTITDKEYLCAELSILLPSNKDKIIQNIQNINNGNSFADTEQELLLDKEKESNADNETKFEIDINIDVKSTIEENSTIESDTDKNENIPQTQIDFGNQQFTISDKDLSPFPIPNDTCKVILFQGAVSFATLLDYFIDKESYLEDKESAYSYYSLTGYGRKLSQTANSAILNISNNFKKSSLSNYNFAHNVLDKFYNGLRLPNNTSSKKNGYYEKEGRTEYILMRGPKGKGQCQVAIKDEAVFNQTLKDKNKNKDQNNDNNNKDIESLNNSNNIDEAIEENYMNNSIKEDNEKNNKNDIIDDNDKSNTELTNNEISLASKIKIFGDQLINNARSTVLSLTNNNSVTSISVNDNDIENNNLDNSNNNIDLYDNNKPKSLRLSMTYVNIPWQTIISDLLNFYDKLYNEIDK